MHLVRLVCSSLGLASLSLTTLACFEGLGDEPSGASSTTEMGSTTTSNTTTMVSTSTTMSPSGSGVDSSSSSNSNGAQTSTGAVDGDTSSSTSGSTTTDPTDTSDGPVPDLPQPVGNCPELSDGMVTFNPAGGSRNVRIWMDPQATTTMDGPVVFYWYGTGGQPSQAQQGLGTGIETITSLGGIVVAPVHVNSGSFPWLEGSEQDYRLADEVVACANQTIGIDARQIHSLGFSAGGLLTALLSFARSSYFASVSMYSGGYYFEIEFEDPSNKFAAMILYGGTSDNVFGFNFENSSYQYQQAMTDNGNFAFLCNHGSGHTIPANLGPAIINFFLDHPYGTDPSPYVAGFPPEIPDYCTLP